MKSDEMASVVDVLHFSKRQIRRTGHDQHFKRSTWRSETKDLWFECTCNQRFCITPLQKKL